MDIQLNEHLEKSLKKEIYKRSYYEFFKDAFVQLHAGEDYNDNWHIKYMCDLLQDELERIKGKKIRQRDIIINIPFRSAKSMITTIIFPVWCWIRDPKIKFICTSYSADLALEHAQRSKDLIMTQWFQEMYGSTLVLRKDQNEKGYYANTWGGFRKSIGAGGTITGSGADIIICDDIINPKKAASETERQNSLDFYNHTLFSRLNQPEIGVRIIVMQRLHEQDIAGHLMDMSPEKHQLIRIPAEITEKAQPFPEELRKYYSDKGLFWPTRFSKSVLNDYWKRLGSYQAAGQLQQLPAPDEGGMIKREWFDIIEAETLERDVVEHPIKFYLDTADTAKTINDPYAIIACYKKDNCVYIIDVTEKHLEFHEACKFIPTYVHNHRYSQNSQIKIEPKSSGKSIVSQLRATTMLNVQELKAPKDDKITRLSAIQPLVEARRVKLIRGAYIDNFLSQLCTFPNAAHDDMVDVFCYSVTDLLTGNNFDFDWL